MKPGFALSLSFDGITLLQRSAAGWRPVGEADPRSTSLTDDLAALRRSANALSPAGFHSKLVIPDDQIRFMTLETGALDENARLEAARAALDGATPYPVSELVFDVHADGDVTQVAAVARDTLKEAEIFAVEHQFNPVSFAAWPADDTVFGREPFFGKTTVAKEVLTESDTLEVEETQRPTDPPIQTAVAAGPPTQSTVEPSQNSEPEPGPEKVPGTQEAFHQDTRQADANFISRRRVPTFRTDPSEPLAVAGATTGSVPGFGEPPAPFEQAPKPKTRRAPDASVLPAPSPVVRKTQSDKERFTIYGADATERTSGRSGGIGGFVLIAVVLVAGLAAFASGAISTQVSDLFARLNTPAPVAQFTAPLQPQATASSEQASEDTAPTELVSLNVSLGDAEPAVLDTVRAPLMVESEPAPLPQTDEVRAAYAATGIWHIAPDVPSPPASIGLEDLYTTDVDPVPASFDVLDLPVLEARGQDSAFLALPSPAPAGTQFTFDDRGFVVATRDGSLNPDGIRVFAGTPPARPPGTMVKIVVPSDDLGEQLRLAAFRPKARTVSTEEPAENSAVSENSRPELSAYRPRMRPQTEADTAQGGTQATAAASASLVPLDNAEGRALLPRQEGTDFTSETANAIVASLRPAARPSNLGDRAQPQPESAPAPASSAAAVRVAPKTVTPKVPSSASAEREATTRNALNLRKVNLIGVYGKPASRRALVRLSNGRYVKVKVGDRIDGGRISAIGDAELRYQKSGRDVVLRMPRG